MLDTELRRSDPGYANQENVYFVRANLKDAKLQYAGSEEAILQWATPNDAQLDSTELRRASVPMKTAEIRSRRICHKWN